MVALDIVMLLILLLSVLIGLWRGLMYEVIVVAGWVAAFVLSPIYAADVAAWLPAGSLSEHLRLAIGFVLVFIVVVFAGGLVAWLVQKAVTSVGLRPVDRILGGGFGLARGAVLLLALALVVNMLGQHDAGWWTESQGGRLLSATLHELRPLLPQTVAAYIP